MRIVDLDLSDDGVRMRCAELLVEGFAEHWPEAWPDLGSALEEVDECAGLGPSRVAFTDDGRAIGWVGVRHLYAKVWELHPLVVDASHRDRGVGRALVSEAERLAAERGGLTLYLGSDDEDAMTSLHGVDLYPEPLVHLARIEDRRRHPFAFYLRCGFSIVGVVPDANGFGKPDIIMAKRLVPER